MLKVAEDPGTTTVTSFSSAASVFPLAGRAPSSSTAAAMLHTRRGLPRDGPTGLPVDDLRDHRAAEVDAARVHHTVGCHDDIEGRVVEEALPAALLRQREPPALRAARAIEGHHREVAPRS